MPEITIDDIERFFKVTAIHGLGFAALLGGVVLAFYFIWWGGNAVVAFINDARAEWAPKIVNGHLGLLKTIEGNSNATTAAVNKLTESTSVSTDNHTKTHRALHYIARAQQEDCGDEAKSLLDDAIRELK